MIEPVFGFEDQVPAGGRVHFSQLLYLDFAEAARAARAVGGSREEPIDASLV
jgi:hypothetical protein